MNSTRLCTLATVAFCLMSPPAAYAQGCRTGAVALANATIRANPLYRLFFGDLESYVSSNRQHFVQGGDAIQCARILSAALYEGAVKAYDPQDVVRQQQLELSLETIGISPGHREPTQSQNLLSTAMLMDRFVRVLPAAAEGDYGPLRTPATELEQLQLLAGQMLVVALQDPIAVAAIRQQEPLIRELADLEYRMFLALAASVAGR